MLHSYGNTTNGNAVGKIHGAVNGIYNPFVLGILNQVAGFFGEDVVVGVIFPDHFDNGFFRGMIHFGYQVIDTFLVRDLEFEVNETSHFIRRRLNGLQ